MDKELFESFNTIAEQWFEEKNYKEALPYYEKLIEFDNKNEDLYSKKALCEKKLNLYKKAIEDYKKAIELNPKNIKNSTNITELFLIVGDYPSAINMRTTLKESDKRNKEYLELICTINTRRNY